MRCPEQARTVRGQRGIFILLLLAIGVLMLLLNAHTPLMMDDYDYSFSWSTGERLDGIKDIFSSQAAHYHIWGGRSVTHFLAQLFLYLGKPVFNIANAVMYIVLLLEIYALCKRRESAWDWRLVLLAHILLFACVEFFAVAFLWLDGACNYLWGTAIALVPLLIARSEREGGFFDGDGPQGVLAIPLCFLAGWTNENTACGILACLVFLLGWDLLRRRKIRLWRVLSLLAQALGVAVMLFAPGNYARASEVSSRSFVMEMLYRAAVVTYCAVRYAGIPAALAAIACATAVKKKIQLRILWLCTLFGGAVLSAFALVGSPQISNRSFTAVIVLMIALLLAVMADKKPAADRHSMHVGAVLFLLAVAAGVHALCAVKQHELRWAEQTDRICLAVQENQEQVGIRSVPSSSRYTMDIVIEHSPDEWPNSTLSRYYGIRIAGE
ncbi:MAG: hypothetical protein IKJ11_09975 [Clostridia bacterium]|nr:hypothetical protein [Clostridia bacterium]